MFSIRRWAAGIFAGFVLAGAGVVVAHADGDDAEPATPNFSIGPAAARAVGEAGTLLFPVFSSRLGEQVEGAEPDFFAYCIEMGVRARFNVDTDLAEWADFPGQNRFTNNPEVQSKVGWIINNSYPTIELPDLRERTGIKKLTAEEAIAGTQHAIWHFTDADRRKLSPRAADLRTYLTGAANVGLPENDVRPQVQIDVSEAANRELGSPIGPFVVKSNIEPIAVTVNADVELLTAAGEPADANGFASGEEFYLDVPEDVGPGSAEIRAQVGAAQVNGSILKVPAASPEYTHAQTLILVTNGTATSTDSAQISWMAPKLPTVVEPITPEVEQKVCQAPGESPDVELLPLATPGVRYDYPQDAVYPGAVVPVTAVAEDGFGLAAAEGWEIQDDGSATTEIHIPVAQCPAEEPSALFEPPAPEAPAEPEEPTLPDTGASSIGLIALAAALSTGGIAVLLVLRRGGTS